MKKLTTIVVSLVFILAFSVVGFADTLENNNEVVGDGEVLTLTPEQLQSILNSVQPLADTDTFDTTTYYNFPKINLQSKPNIGAQSEPYYLTAVMTGYGVKNVRVYIPYDKVQYFFTAKQVYEDVTRFNLYQRSNEIIVCTYLDNDTKDSGYIVFYPYTAPYVYNTNSGNWQGCVIRCSNPGLTFNGILTFVNTPYFEILKLILLATLVVLCIMRL